MQLKLFVQMVWKMNCQNSPYVMILIQISCYLIMVHWNKVFYVWMVNWRSDFGIGI